MIKKLECLSDKELKKFYKSFADKLLEVFGEYDNLNQLQEAFHSFKNDDVEDYRECLDNILYEIAPSNIELNWKDFKKLTKNRWKLCKVCGHPFLSFDKKNRMKYCYSNAYKRYRKGRKDFAGNYIEGKYFKSAEHGLSSCFMISEAVRKRINNKDEFDYIVGF